MGALTVHEAASAMTKGGLDYRNLDHKGFIADGNRDCDLRDRDRNFHGSQHIDTPFRSARSANGRLFI
jgi:hypothetical protein